MSVIVMHQQPQMQQWAASDCDMCIDGGGTCAYAFFCMPCAAGDVATGAGKDFCMSCCVVPWFCGGVLPPCVPCIVACCWAGDRAALAMRYNIIDNNAGCISCCKMTCGCATCLLVQELHEIKVQQIKRMNQGPSMIVLPQQQQMAPAAPVINITNTSSNSNNVSGSNSGSLATRTPEASSPMASGGGFCSKCGTGLAPGSPFCGGCGNPTGK